MNTGEAKYKAGHRDMEALMYKHGKRVSEEMREKKSKVAGKMKKYGGKLKKGERYIAPDMPKHYSSMTYNERSEYYKKNKGFVGSTKVNPKTGKYYDTK